MAVDDQYADDMTTKGAWRGRPTVNLSMRRASLADARLLGSLFCRSFTEDPMCSWYYQWPARGSPDHSAAMEDAQRLRLPDAKRRLVSRKYHYFMASDEDTGEVIGTVGWLIPNTENAKHHERKLGPYERIAGLAYRLYDAIVNNLIPDKLYTLFDPEGEARRQRQVRWRAEMAKVPKPVNHAIYEREGYWHLSFICVVPEYAGRGVGSLLLQWGLERADEDDRAVYVTASPSGMRVYERAGFQAVYSAMVLQDEEGGPIHLCTMYRPPKSERQQERLVLAG